MFAVGPVAILPSPLWAAVPATTPFTTSSGTATWNGAGNTGTINASNRAVLNWGTTVQGDTTTLTNFFIAGGETFNFILPSGGAVLNRVTAGNNLTAAGGITAAAIINGSLLSSNGAVLILANGNIVVGAGSQISTASGLVLSTLAENDFNFTATGNLALNGTPQGQIILGTGATTASIIGNLTAAGAAIIPSNLTVSGDFAAHVRTNGQALALTTGAGTTVGGNFTATTNNGAITQGAGALVVANGHTSLSSGTGTINLPGATNDFKTLTANTSTLTGNVTIRDGNIVTLGASTVGGDFNITATGIQDSTAIQTSGTLTIGGNASFTQSTTDNSAINIANNTTVAGGLSLAGNNSSVTFSGLGNITLGNTATSVAGVTIAAGSNSVLAVTTNGVLNIGNTVTVTGGSNNRAGITLTAASINQTAGITTTGGNGSISMNATAGGITLNNLVNSSGSAGTGIALRTSGGAITQAVGTTITTTNATGTSSINVTTSGVATLNNPNSFASGTTLQVLAAGSATINNTGLASNILQIGTANVTGALSVINNNTNSSVVLGGPSTGSAAQNLVIGGNLNVTVGGTGTITDNDYSDMTIFGALNLTAVSGAITLDAATANGSLAPNIRLGQVRITTTGAASVAESTTLNLGNITASTLTATSATGDIINTGDIMVTTANFRAGANGTATITNATNTITNANFLGRGGSLTVASPVTIGATTNVTSGDLVITTTGGAGITLGGATVAGNLTANSSGTITTVAGAGATLAGQSNTTVGGNLTLIAADTTAGSIVQAANGRYVVTGATNIQSSGNVTLNQANDFMGGVVLNQASSLGNVQVFDLNDLRISGNAGGAVDARSGQVGAVSIDAPWNIVLGNLNVASLNVTAATGGGGGSGTSGTVTQAAGTSIHSEGTFRATTNNNNIVLTNNGNSAGRVEFFTNGGTNNATGTISYTEDGTIRLGNIASNSNITLRSNFGSVIEDTNAAVVFNSRATLNVTAANGSINLGNTTQSTFTTSGNVNGFIASAPNGSVSIWSNNNLNLGNIRANSLTVTATNNISQSGSINVFGTASFNSTQTTIVPGVDTPRSIVLTNNTNNFGPVTLIVSNNTTTISVIEANTLNLRSVQMPGGGNSTFTAQSLNGNIMTSGFGGVRLGGNATTTGSGIVTLTAQNGNIDISENADIATTSGIVFNAKDVTLSVLGSSGSVVSLGASSAASVATGNLTVRSLTGSIGNTGAFTAGGLATFEAPNGSIIIGQSGVGFAQLKFVGQQVSISEGGNMDILTGSSSFGPASLVSGGNINIVPVGGVVSFGSTVRMQASGNITLPKLVQAGGLLTVTSPNAVNLSALSIQGDLNGITPFDETPGTGTYAGPQP